MRCRLTLLTTALAVAFSPLAFSSVVIVDANGGGDFTEVNEAIFAAAPGDTVLVRAGVYFNALEIAKSVSIIADPPGAVVQCPNMYVLGVPAGGSVLLRGIDLISTSSIFPAAYILPGCQAPVVLEDCELTGGPSSVLFFPIQYLSHGQPAIYATSAAPVVAVRCTLTGGAGFSAATVSGQAYASTGGGRAVFAESDVALYDCIVAAGAPGNPAAGTTGGNAITLFDASPFAPFKVLVSGCTVTGGAGAIGGAAINDLSPAAATLYTLDSVITGGTGTVQNGPAMALSAGVSHVAWNNVARSLTLTSHAAQFAPVTVDLQGVQGDTVFAFLAMQSGAVLVPGAHGFLTASLPVIGPIALGTLANPSGQASFTVPAPALPSPAFAGITIVLDPVFVNPAYDPVFGAPSTFALLE